MNPPLPARAGHFVLESGLHTDRWVSLDALFNDPGSIAPSIDRLAALLAPHRPATVCGPMTGGALLAHAIAMRMGLDVLYTQRAITDEPRALYPARYELPEAQREAARGRDIALVDDMISAGSSTLASLDFLSQAGGNVVVVGALYLAGDVGAELFARRNIRVVALERYPLQLWKPDECPLCRFDEPLSIPTG